MENENKQLVTQGGGALMVANLEAQVNTIQLAMKNLMKEGVHYGTIPGCGDKPALFKSGAEKILFMFRMAPRFEVEKDDLGHGHREVTVRSLIHDSEGNFLGEGLGSCSTKESKYRWRNAGKVCPACQFTGSIFRQKAEWGGGFYCNAGKGGCGEKFNAGSDGCKAIDKQDGGKVENPDIADQYNTVLKMAKKRSLVDGTLTVTAASDVFEQDLDTYSEAELEEIRSNRKESGKPKTEPPKAKNEKKTPPKTKKAPATVEGDSDSPSESLEKYKQDSVTNKENLDNWWHSVREQAEKELGTSKFKMLKSYLIGFHKMELDD